MAGFHKYNHGLVTSGLALSLEAFSFTVDSGGDVVSVDDGNANLVLSAAKSATGEYTVTLNLPYPPSLVALTGSTSQAAETDDSVTVSKQAYTASTGVLILNCTSNTTATNPGDGQSVSVIAVFQRYSRL